MDSLVKCIEIRIGKIAAENARKWRRERERQRERERERKKECVDAHISFTILRSIISNESSGCVWEAAARKGACGERF